MKLHLGLASCLVLLLSTASAHADEFVLSADWPESSPVFRANHDKAGDDQYTNYREPVVVRTTSGRLVIGVHAGNRLGWPERSGQDLAVRISSDDGKTWGPIIVATEHGDRSCQCHGLVYDAEKDRLLFLYTVYNWDYTAVGNKRGQGFTDPIYEKMADEGQPFVTSYMVHSDDEGLTWSEPREIPGEAGIQKHFGASEGRQLTLGEHRGRLLLAGSRMQLDPRNGHILHKTPGVWHSDDHGATWTLAEVPMDPELNTPRNASSEARITELADGTLLYNQRTRNTGRHLSWSTDGGTTWSETRQAVELKASQCNGCTITLRDGQGDLTNTVLFSVPSPGGRSQGVIYASFDGGKTWPITKNVIAGAFAYSALVQLDAETVGLFHEGNHYQDIYFVALPLAELLSSDEPVE